MIRVSGGRLRGRQIESPPRAKDIRPTTAMIRESLFSRFQKVLPGCRFLDLFAGSGIMGIEALSRGAAFVLAVEADPQQARRIREQYTKLGLAEQEAKIIAHDATALLARPCREEGFDLVFLDPPYGFAKLEVLVRLLEEHGWLKPGASVIVEHGKRDADLPGFVRKDYGDTSVSVRTGWTDSGNT